jgi:hypothetical protein
VNFFGKVNDALKALRKLVPRLRDWLVAPKSDEGGSENTLGNSQKINSSPVGTGEDVRRTGEGRGEIFNNQMVEILSRSRKVRTQIPNKTDFVQHPQPELGGAVPLARSDFLNKQAMIHLTQKNSWATVLHDF